MDRLLKKILLFIFCFTLINIPLFVVYRNIIINSSPFQLDRKFNLINDPVTSLFIGSSHLEAAVDDSDFKNSFNFSSSGQSFEENYLILKDNITPHLKRVIISFSSFSFHQTNKMPILNNTYYEYPLQSNNMIERYILDFTKYDRFFIRPFRLKNLQTEINFKNHAKIKTKVHFKYEQMGYGLHYYEKIIELSKIHGFELIFITTPFSKEYFTICNKKKSWNDDKVKLNRDAKENNFNYLNFESIYVENQSHHEYFRDSDHLNLNGRKRFRNQLCSVIDHDPIESESFPKISSN